MNQTMSNDSLVLRSRDRPVGRYVTRPELPPRLSPRPYLHPVTTLAGTAVTELSPADHAHHLGVGVAVPDVEGHNFWGGRTYVRDQGPTELDNHGAQRHAELPTARPRRLRGGAALGGRGRRAAARAAYGRRRPNSPTPPGRWTSRSRSPTRPPSALSIGSPATNGRPGAAYGGFFWRARKEAEAPRVFTAGTEGEEAVHGSRADWLALAGANWTLVFAGATETDPPRPVVRAHRRVPGRRLLPRPRRTAAGRGRGDGRTPGRHRRRRRPPRPGRGRGPGPQGGEPVMARLLRPRRRHLPQPRPRRRLVRPRPAPRRRRLLPHRLQLRPRPGPAAAALPRPGQLDARRPRPPTPRTRTGVQEAPARLRGVGTVPAPPRRPLLDLLGRPRPRHLPGQRPRDQRPLDPPAPRQGGQGAHRRLPAVGRGERRGVSRARLGQVPLRRQEPAHRPPDAARRHRTARRRQGDRRRRPHPRLVHARRAQAVPARRLVLDLRPRRRSGDRLAGRLPLARLLRPVRGAGRPRAGRHRRQRPPPGRLGAHRVRRGLVRALPGARARTGGSSTSSRCAGARTAGRCSGTRAPPSPYTGSPICRGSRCRRPPPTTTSPAAGSDGSGSGPPTRRTAGPPSTPATGCG